MLPGTPLDSAKGPLERIRDAVAAYNWESVGSGMRLTITVGTTQLLAGETADALVRRADMALYLEEKTGRDRVVIDYAAFAKLTNSAAN